MYSAAGGVVKKQRKKGRRGGGKAREIGGVNEAAKIIQGAEGSSEEGEGDERDEDATNLDDIVSGDYLDAYKREAENVVPAGREEWGVREEVVVEEEEEEGLVGEGQNRRVVKREVMSPLTKKLNRINKEVSGAQKRLDKQLRLLRGKGFASDPKSAQEVVEEVARKEKEKRVSREGGKKRGGGGGRSPLKSLMRAKEGFVGGDKDLRVEPAM